MKICPVGAESLPMRTDGRTDITNLKESLFFFGNFAYLCVHFHVPLWPDDGPSLEAPKLVAVQ